MASEPALRVGFAGTPEFARRALAALFEAGHDVALVLTQPDRPAGRGMRLHASPVKQWAAERGLPLLQPRGLRLDGKFPDDASAARDALHRGGLDVLVVAAYGLILPAWVLALPRSGCLNLHASLLPRWRGAAPIQRAIEAGDAQTGITVMQMDAGLDTGDMLLTRSTPIGVDDTSASLTERLGAIAAGLIVEALTDLARGRLRPVPQPVQGVTYAHKIAKTEAAVDWRQPARAIERRLRAFDPDPGCTAELFGHRVKLWRGRIVAGAGAPGEVLQASGARLVLACGSDALEVLELQRPGGRRVTVREFLSTRPPA